MVDSYVAGVGLVVAMAVGWAAVQSAWRKTFPGVCADPDVLAGRASCRGCSGPCDRGRERQEERR